MRAANTCTRCTRIQIQGVPELRLEVYANDLPCAKSAERRKLQVGPVEIQETLKITTTTKRHIFFFLFFFLMSTDRLKYLNTHDGQNQIQDPGSYNTFYEYTIAIVL